MDLSLLSLLLFYSLSQAQDGESSTFQVEYTWTFLNFTWETAEAYQDAIDAKTYIPANNAMTGFKFFEDRLFIGMPRIREGTPVTFGYIPIGEDAVKENPLITPFPDWETNDLEGDCATTLVSVVSMEIDTQGVMWIIDGHRTRSIKDCPPKLILYDLNNDNEVVQSYDFPDDVCLSSGGYLNDIVVDETDGGYAYISEHSNIDPGLIVYSREQNKAWKLRDPSMFGEPVAAHFTVADMTSNSLSPIDGIALSPSTSSGSRYVYWSAVTAYSFYALDTKLAKDVQLYSNGNWRYNITRVGTKQAQGDGMLVDNEGNLYYGLLTLLGVGKWNINEDFSTSEIVDQNNETMIWTDGFAFDNDGHLYLLSNHILDFVFTGDLEVTDEVIFTLSKVYTGTKSYLH